MELNRDLCESLVWHHVWFPFKLTTRYATCGSFASPYNIIHFHRYPFLCTVSSGCHRFDIQQASQPVLRRHRVSPSFHAVSRKTWLFQATVSEKWRNGPDLSALEYQIQSFINSHARWTYLTTLIQTSGTVGAIFYHHAGGGVKYTRVPLELGWGLS